jgi:hypothetical protein
MVDHSFIQLVTVKTSVCGRHIQKSVDGTSLFNEKVTVSSQSVFRFKRTCFA